MKSFASIRPSTWLFYVGIVVVCMSPVWGVTYFVNQDGSGHVQTASLMGQLLAGNEAAAGFYKFNSIAVPNSSGHWILLFLLQIFPAFTVTKIFVSLSFAMFVGGAGWLRFQTAGPEGVKTSLMIGAALGFNWLWLVGFYNFTLGVICLMFVIGYFYRRVDRIGIADTILLSLLLMLVYFSHIVTFLILAGSIFVIILFTPGVRRTRTLLFAFFAVLPILPFALKFRSTNEDGFSPVWRGLDNAYSLTSWIHQMRIVDPFIIISRKTFPFVNEVSGGFAVFTPVLWIFIAFLCLTLASSVYYRKHPESLRPFAAFFVLVAGAMVLALFGPDDFSLTNGGVLRERFFICGLLFCIPLFRSAYSVWLKWAAQTCLLFVVAFQTMAVWEYALNSDKQSKIFMSASDLIRNSPSSAMITVKDGSLRFHADPVPQLNCYNGIGTNNIVWDNYEFGHYLFPLITKDPMGRQFIHDLTGSQYLGKDDADDAFGGYETKLARINSGLAIYNDRIETIVLWGRDERIEAILSKWYNTEPYFENGKLRLFHHK